MLHKIKRYVPESLKPPLRAVLNRTHRVVILSRTFYRTFGLKYRCSVCGGHVRYFEPLPEYYRQNLQKFGWTHGDGLADVETCNVQSYTCPLCGADDRCRLYALYFRHYLTQVKPSGACSIVDFAPERSLTLFIRRLAARSGRPISYRTADLKMKGVDDIVDIENMPLYVNDQFDFFFCSHVLEHVRNDLRALSELRRILKPGGSGILMVPIVLSVDQIDEDPCVTDAGERWRRFGQDDHVRLYSKKGFIDRVKNAGFLLRELGEGFFGREVYAKNGIASRSVLYIVEKAAALPGDDGGFRVAT